MYNLDISSYSEDLIGADQVTLININGQNLNIYDSLIATSGSLSASEVNLVSFSAQNIYRTTVLANGVVTINDPSSSSSCLLYSIHSSSTLASPFCDENTFSAGCDFTSAGSATVNLIYLSLPNPTADSSFGVSTFHAPGSLTTMGNARGVLVNVNTTGIEKIESWGGEIHMTGDINGAAVSGISFEGTGALSFESMAMGVSGHILSWYGEQGAVGIDFGTDGDLMQIDTTLVVSGVVGSQNLGAAIGISLRSPNPSFNGLTGRVFATITSDSNVAAGLELRLSHSAGEIIDSSFHVLGEIDGVWSYGIWCQMRVGVVKGLFAEVRSTIAGSMQAIGICLAQMTGEYVLPDEFESSFFLVHSDASVEVPSLLPILLPSFNRPFKPSEDVFTVGILVDGEPASRSLRGLSCEVSGKIGGVGGMGGFLKFPSPNYLLQGIRMVFTGRMELLSTIHNPDAFVYLETKTEITSFNDTNFLFVSLPTNAEGDTIPAFYLKIPETTKLENGRVVAGYTGSDAISFSTNDLGLKNVEFLGYGNGVIKLNSEVNSSWTDVTITGLIKTPNNFELGGNFNKGWCRVNLFHLSSGLLSILFFTLCM